VTDGILPSTTGTVSSTWGPYDDRCLAFDLVLRDALHVGLGAPCAVPPPAGAFRMCVGRAARVRAPPSTAVFACRLLGLLAFLMVIILFSLLDRIMILTRPIVIASSSEAPTR
jgi:hypothetical protein